MKKLLALSIIFLFIGVAVAPSINQCVVTASQDDDLVEVTTQACGIKGYGNTTVKLTREQANELDQLFEIINSKLNNATSWEESARIYHDAIIKLDRYGLLPQGMTIEQAQHLVLGGNQNRIERVLKREQEIFPNYNNVFCLVSLHAIINTDPYYSGFMVLGIDYIIGNLLLLLSDKFGLDNLGDIFYLLIMSLFFFPLKLMNLVMIFGYKIDVSTFGLKGYEGAIDSNECGVLGYTGLMFMSLPLNNDPVYPDIAYFLGYGLAVKFD